MQPVADVLSGVEQENTGWSWRIDGKGLVIDVDDPQTPDRSQHVALGLGWMEYVGSSQLIGVWCCPTLCRVGD